MTIAFILKLLLFTFIQFIPLYIWFVLLKKKDIKVDFRLIVSYFLFGSWFGMYGELFLFKFIDLLFHAPIWEYRLLPIHNGITSSFGPIMWGNAAIYICFHKNYPLKPSLNAGLLRTFALESLFLLVLETVFNVIAILIFNDYYFYYFVPDLFHLTSLTNLPFWWVGYQLVVKYGNVMYRQEKLSLTLAIMMIVIAFTYQ